MNKVPIIRKNSYKDYLGSGLLGGFFAGLLFMLITLLGSGSLSTSLSVGAGVWVFIIIIYMTVGFPSEEYFKRKKMIASLQSDKTAFFTITTLNFMKISILKVFLKAISSGYIQ